MDTNIHRYVYIHTQKLLVKIITSIFQTILPCTHTHKISRNTFTHREKNNCKRSPKLQHTHTHTQQKKNVSNIKRK